VSYDLINLVKKLHKVRKNPERAFHVVRGDLANFFGFHRFGIKESAINATARTRGHTSGGSLFFTESKFTAMCGEIVVLTGDFYRCGFLQFGAACRTQAQGNSICDTSTTKGGLAQPPTGKPY
jgi:hypothetical protein